MAVIEDKIREPGTGYYTTEGAPEGYTLYHARGGAGSENGATGAAPAQAAGRAEAPVGNTPNGGTDLPPRAGSPATGQAQTPVVQQSTPAGQQGAPAQQSSGSLTVERTGTVPQPGQANQYSADLNLRPLLDAQYAAAQEQQRQAIDYATQRGVNELQRAQQDAQQQFQTQQNQVSADEQKALDNQALYAEARGDRGGIGQAQYAQIQNEAMQNRRAINTARTQLATDTARQIADLRAQGEFEKADKLLQLTQSYLGQLIDLEQWNANFGLSVAKFNEELAQWEREYALSEARITGRYNGQLTWDAQREQQADAQKLVEAMLSAGVAVDDATLARAGLSREYAAARRLEYQSGQAAQQQASLAKQAIDLIKLGVVPDEAMWRAAGFTSQEAAQAAANAQLWKLTKNGDASAADGSEAEAEPMSDADIEARDARVRANYPGQLDRWNAQQAGQTLAAGAASPPLLDWVEGQKRQGLGLTDEAGNALLKQNAAQVRYALAELAAANVAEDVILAKLEELRDALTEEDYQALVKEIKALGA